MRSTVGGWPPACQRAFRAGRQRGKLLTLARQDGAETTGTAVMLRIILSNRWFTLLWAVSIMFTALRFAGKDGAAEKAVAQANRHAPASRGESDGLTNQAAVLASQVITGDSPGQDGDGHTMIRYPENSWAQQQIAAQQQGAARAKAH